MFSTFHSSDKFIAGQVMNSHIVNSLAYILFIQGSLFGQFSFKERSTEYLGNQKSRSAVMLGVQDMNGDYLDDLVTLDLGRYLFVAISRGKDNPMKISKASLPVSTGREWSFAIGDLDNDNIPEILTTGIYNDLKVFGFDPQTGSFESKQNIFSQAYGQGCNIIDLDQDGHNDVFLCHDEGMSRVFMNEGDGTLKRVSGMIDFSTQPVTDMSGNYGSEWVDIDDDGIPELYIAKCKAGSNSYQDPRRINQLYKRGEDGIYRDIAPSLGLALGHQSWSAVFADLDNDGDLDCIVANHYDRHMILENVNGVFHERKLDFDIPLTFAFQVMTADLDNNGFEDVLFTGDRDFVLRNTGNFQFELVYFTFSTQRIHSAAIGDINGDGFVDVYTSFGQPIIDLGNRYDGLYINNGNSNHHAVFSLRGTSSNSRGVGAKIKIYGPWGVQQRNIKAGQGYGIVHSTNAYFGLGESHLIDSALIIWPGGKRQVFHHLETNKHYIVYESGCIGEKAKIHTETGNVFCPDAQLQLFSEDHLNGIVWNNDIASAYLTVREPDSYFYTYVNDEGCVFPSEVVSINTPDSIEEMTQIVADTLHRCVGQLLTLPQSQSLELLWLDNLSTTFQPPSSGLFEYIIYGNCNFQATVDTYINLIEADITHPLKDTIEQGTDFSLIVPGMSAQWYIHADDLIPVFIGNQWSPDIFSDTVFYVSIETYVPKDTFHAGPVAPEGPNRYAANSINARMNFEILKPLYLESVDVYTDTRGVRRFILGRTAGDTLAYIDQDLEPGKNTIIFRFHLEPGLFFLTTDEMSNFRNLGIRGPRLERTEKQFIFFPYKAEDYFQIDGSDRGENFFFFYDWKVTEPTENCVSGRIPYQIKFNQTTSVEFLNPTNVKVYPNPTRERLQIKGLSGISTTRMMVTDIMGRLLLQKEIFSQEDNIQLDVNTLNPGVYILIVDTGGKIYPFRFIKVE
ncbi:MAG TPA: FG-GAP-like repeat-containing protein [Saprospiraceae bacterium]|nr:FG-GAP-like repeat-containing protein [Saprospiraceae bacterium]